MSYYPYVGFSFQVNFLNLPEKKKGNVQTGTVQGSKTQFDKRIAFSNSDLPTLFDAHFQSVKGLEIQFDTETIKEGGVNDFEHVVPTKAKPSTLTLERGMFQPENSPLIKWCKDAFSDFHFTPINMQVTLLSENRKPLFTWQLEHVLPKSWKIKDLNAQQGEVLLETLELTYNRMRFYPEI
jgi:phage tail-like protein